MKKLLVLLGIMVFLAAACDTNTTSSVEITPHSTTKGSSSVSGNATVDAAVNKLNANIDSEDSVSTQSVDDIVNSDQSVINSYNGAANVNY